MNRSADRNSGRWIPVPVLSRFKQHICQMKHCTKFDGERPNPFFTIFVPTKWLFRPFLFLPVFAALRMGAYCGKRGDRPSFQDFNC